MHILLKIIKLLPFTNRGKAIAYRFLKTREFKQSAKSQRISAWESIAVTSLARRRSKMLGLYPSRRWEGRRVGFIRWQPISFAPPSGRHTRNFLDDYPPLCFIPENFADCYPDIRGDLL